MDNTSIIEKIAYKTTDAILHELLVEAKIINPKGLDINLDNEEPKENG